MAGLIERLGLVSGARVWRLSGAHLGGEQLGGVLGRTQLSSRLAPSRSTQSRRGTGEKHGELSGYSLLLWSGPVQR